MMRTNRTATTLLLVLLTAASLPAVSVSAGATLQLPPASNAAIYGLGVGGRVAVGFEPRDGHWLTIEPEFSALHYQPNIEGFGTAWMLLPGVALQAQMPVSLSDSLASVLGLSIAYRHYFWLSRYDAQEIRAYRPVVAGGAHAFFVVSDSLHIGPAVSYNVFFDELIRGTVQLELRARYRITHSP